MQNKLKIKINGQELAVDIIESKTSQEFIEMLPLTLEMKDFYRREKYADIENKLSADENASEVYETGYLYYWLGGGVVVFYNHDGKTIKGGLVKLAKIDQGLELFSEGDTANVTFET